MLGNRFLFYYRKTGGAKYGHILGGKRVMRCRVEDLKPGMILGEDIHCCKTGRRLLSRKSRLTHYSINYIIKTNDYSEIEFISEQESLKDKKLKAKEIISKINNLILSEKAKKLYHNLYDSIDHFFKDPNSYHWNRCKNNIYKFLNNDKYNEMVYVCKTLPLSKDRRAQTINTIIQAMVLFKEIVPDANKDLCFKLCQSTIFSCIGLEKFEDDTVEHIEYGVQVLKNISREVDEIVLQGVLEHHERLDGSGFPQGKKEVSIIAQTIGISEEYCDYLQKNPGRGDCTVSRPYWPNKFDRRLIQTLTTKIVLLDNHKLFTEDGREIRVLSIEPNGRAIVKIESENDFMGWKYSTIDSTAKQIS